MVCFLAMSSIVFAASLRITSTLLARTTAPIQRKSDDLYFTLSGVSTLDSTSVSGGMPMTEPSFTAKLYR